MRRLKSAARFSALAFLALAALSCGAPTQSPESRSARSHENESVEDSGKHLSGDFILIAIEDAYRKDRTQSQVVFTFDDDGEFKRQDRSRIEEGTYLITPQSELVIYVEKVNGELRSAAKVEEFEIRDQRDDGFTLQEGPSVRLVLRKR